MQKIVKLSLKDESDLRDKIALAIYQGSDRTPLGAYKEADDFLLARTENKEIGACACGGAQPKPVNSRTHNHTKQQVIRTGQEQAKPKKPMKTSHIVSAVVVLFLLGVGIAKVVGYLGEILSHS